MNQEFIKRETLFLVQLLLGSLLLYGMHSYLLGYLAKDILFFFPLWNAYLFHIASVFIVYTVINFRFSNGKKEVFNAFMVLMILKMVFAVVFLLPLILSEIEKKTPDVLNFFLPYFVFLAFEVYSVTNFLKAGESS